MKIAKQKSIPLNDCFSDVRSLVFVQAKVLPLLVELSHGALAPKKPENNVETSENQSM